VQETRSGREEQSNRLPILQEVDMAEKETKLPVKKEPAAPSPYSGFFDWHPFDALRRQIDRVFEEFPLRKSVTEFEPFERFLAGAGLFNALCFGLIERGDFSLFRSGSV
jgi:hypothetical protein